MSSETKFTPGPWGISQWPSSGAIYGVSSNKGLVCCIDKASECQEANTHLIAAAPDLYAACERALSHMKAMREVFQIPMIDPMKSAIEGMESALKKARGDQ